MKKTKPQWWKEYTLKPYGPTAFEVIRTDGRNLGIITLHNIPFYGKRWTAESYWEGCIFQGSKDEAIEWLCKAGRK